MRATSREHHFTNISFQFWLEQLSATIHFRPESWLRAIQFRAHAGVLRALPREHEYYRRIEKPLVMGETPLGVLRLQRRCAFSGIRTSYDAAVSKFASPGLQRKSGICKFTELVRAFLSTRNNFQMFG